MAISYSGMVAAALIAMIFSLTAVFFLGKKEPWGSIWTFFIILFLALWSVSIYVAPIGPALWGIAWVPLTVAGLIVATLLIAAMPHPNINRDDISATTSSDSEVKSESPQSLSGRFFWILIILLTMAIMIGIFNPQRAM